MPSQRKRIGFLPSEEVHEIIDKLCKANQFSQSKVTGLLVEEALRSRGVLNDAFSIKTCDRNNFSNNNLGQEPFTNNNRSPIDNNDYKVNKKLLFEEVKMINEFIEYKYFKRIMNQIKIFLMNKCHTK